MNNTCTICFGIFASKKIKNKICCSSLKILSHRPAACSLRPSAYESVLFIRTAGTQFSDLYTAVDTVG